MSAEDDRAEATRQGARYLMLAELCEGQIPYAAALFRFAAKQLGEFVKDGLEWHARAATAAAHDARTIANNIAARQKLPGVTSETPDSPGSLG